MNSCALEELVPCGDNRLKPLCWDWNASQVMVYVQERKGKALRAFEKESKDAERHQERQDFETLVNQILLHCLQNYKVYALSERRTSKGQNIIVPLEFTVRLRNRRVPISDLYSALGWFMSYAEPAYSGPGAMQAYRIRHLCYTRICLNIGYDLSNQDAKRQMEAGIVDQSPSKPFPTKTHLFLVGEFPLLTSYERPSDNWTPPNWTHNLSASLPGDMESAALSGIKNKPSGSLRKARDLRKEALNRLPLTSPPIQHVTNNMRTLERWTVGNCAETLNVIGNYRADGLTVGFGEALDVWSTRGDFTTFDDILCRAQADPCKECCYLLTNSMVTQQELSRGVITGPIPPPLVPAQNWMQMNNMPRCLRCQRGVATELIPCQNCGQKAWCTDDCYAGDSQVHGGQCGPQSGHGLGNISWTAHSGNSASASAWPPSGSAYPPFIHAAAATAPPDIARHYGYYNTAGSHQFNPGMGPFNPR